MRVPSFVLFRARRGARLALGAGAALSALAGCNVFDEALEARLQSDASGAPGRCRVHADCGASEQSPAACVAATQGCVPLESEDCQLVAGSLRDPNALVIGALFSLTGSQASTNLARQQSALLAVEEINAAGGIPPASGSGKGRPLVLVACDEAQDLRRAGRHLTSALRVPAIIGPNTSQDTIDLTNELSAMRGTLLLSPTSVASSVSDLRDEGLTFTMVPSDVQRSPLMKQQIGELEAKLLRERQKPTVKLGIIYRDDALGVGTRVSLNTLTLNGKPLPDSLGTTVKIDRYQVDAPDQSMLVDGQVAFAPDIVVLAGTAEAITQVMVPLEQRWAGGPRPHYVLIDSVKVPELLAAVAGDDDLRQRVRGTGVVPTLRSQPVYDAFRVDYETRFPGGASTISGVGPAYDATYAIAYALAATRSEPVSGASIARGLRKLSGGAAASPLESTRILAAFAQLAAGDAIDAIGTFGPLQWDEHGAPTGGRVEIWCIAGGSAPAFRSSGLTLDLQTQQVMGRYEPCGRSQ